MVSANTSGRVRGRCRICGFRCSGSSKISHKMNILATANMDVYNLETMFSLTMRSSIVCSVFPKNPKAFCILFSRETQISQNTERRCTQRISRCCTTPKRRVRESFDGSPSPAVRRCCQLVITHHCSAFFPSPRSGGMSSVTFLAAGLALSPSHHAFTWGSSSTSDAYSVSMK